MSFKASLVVIELLCLFLNANARYLAFVGGQDIYVFELDPSKGALTQLSLTPQSNSGWLAPFPAKNPTLLLSTGPNQITLYSVNSSNGRLSFLNGVGSGGVGPAYVSWNGKGTYALVANYGTSDTSSEGASVAVLPVTSTNQRYALQAASDIVYHYGNGTNPDRQTGPHPHETRTDSNGVFTFVPDLGLDKIFQYVLQDNGTLINNTYEYAKSGVGGDGPRHMTWHPTNKFAYVLNEVVGSVDVYTYDTTTGLLTGPVQTISTLPEGWSGDNRAAEIITTPDGKYLYASNRGFDSIVSFQIDANSKDAHLKLITWTTYLVTYPRNFAIDPAGRLLLVGSSASNEIVAFSINATSGILTPTGAVTSVPNAICIQIVEVS